MLSVHGNRKLDSNSASANAADIKRAIHARALEVAGRFRKCEIELIEVLQEVERHRVYLHFGCNSLFQYATGALGLSEEVSYIFIRVARKASEVPELKAEIK